MIVNQKYKIILQDNTIKLNGQFLGINSDLSNQVILSNTLKNRFIISFRDISTNENCIGLTKSNIYNNIGKVITVNDPSNTKLTLTKYPSLLQRSLKYYDFQFIPPVVSSNSLFELSGSDLSRNFMLLYNSYNKGYLNSNYLKVDLSQNYNYYSTYDICLNPSPYPYSDTSINYSIYYDFSSSVLNSTKIYDIQNNNPTCRDSPISSNINYKLLYNSSKIFIKEINFNQDISFSYTVKNLSNSIIDTGNYNIFYLKYKCQPRNIQDNRLIFQNNIIKLKGNFLHIGNPLKISNSLRNGITQKEYLKNKVFISIRDPSKNNYIAITQSNIYNNLVLFNGNGKRGYTKRVLLKNYSESSELTHFKYNIERLNEIDTSNNNYLIDSSSTNLNQTNYINLFNIKSSIYSRFASQNMNLFDTVYNYHTDLSKQAALAKDSTDISLSYYVKYDITNDISNNIKLWDCNNNINNQSIDESCQCDEIIRGNYNSLSTSNVYINNIPGNKDISFSYMLVNYDPFICSQRNNFIEKGKVNLLFLYYRPPTITPQANRIIFQNKIMKFNGNFISRENPLSIPSKSSDFYKNRIFISLRDISNSKNYIGLTKSNVYNNINIEADKDNPNNKKIVFSKYNSIYSRKLKYYDYDFNITDISNNYLLESSNISGNFVHIYDFSKAGYCYYGTDQIDMSLNIYNANKSKLIKQNIYVSDTSVNYYINYTTSDLKIYDNSASTCRDTPLYRNINNKILRNMLYVNSVKPKLTNIDFSYSIINKEKCNIPDNLNNILDSGSINIVYLHYRIQEIHSQDNRIIFHNNIIKINGSFTSPEYNFNTSISNLPQRFSQSNYLNNRIFISMRDTSNHNNIIGITQSNIYNNIKYDPSMRQSNKFVIGSYNLVEQDTKMKKYIYNLPECSNKYLLNTTDFSYNLLLSNYKKEGYCYRAQTDINLYNKYIDFSNNINRPQRYWQPDIDLEYYINYDTSALKIFDYSNSTCSATNYLEKQQDISLSNNSNTVYVREIYSSSNDISINDVSFTYKIFADCCYIPDNSYNIIDSGSVKFLYLIARRHQHSDICLNELNKIIFTRNNIKMSGQFLDSQKNFNNINPNNEFFKNTILLSHKPKKNSRQVNKDSTICLTRSNLFNNVLNLNDERKIILQKYNQYSDLNSYNINLNYNDHTYLFDVSNSNIPNDLSFISYQMFYDIKQYRYYYNDLSFNYLNNYVDFSYVFNIYPYLINNYKYNLYNDSYSAFNTNLNIYDISSNRYPSDMKLIGNNSLQSDSQINIKDIVPNLPVNFKFSIYDSKCCPNNFEKPIEINDVNILNYYPNRDRIYAYDIETIYKKPPSLNYIDISATTLLASNIYSYNTFTGTPIYYFDGSSVYYNINLNKNNNIGSSDGYTFSLWINSTNMIESSRNVITSDICNNYLSNSYTILDFRNKENNQNSIVLSITGNEIKYTIDNNNWQGRAIPKSISIKNYDINNTWYHIAITHNKLSRKAIIYINGKNVKSQELRYPVNTYREKMFLGKNAILSDNYLQGKITDLLIFDTEFNNSNIDKLYNNISEQLYTLYRNYNPIVTFRSIYQDNTIINYYIKDISELSGVGFLYEYDGSNSNSRPEQITIPYSDTVHDWKLLDYDDLDDLSRGINEVKFVRNYNKFNQYGDYVQFLYYAKNTEDFIQLTDLCSNIAFSSYILDNIPYAYSDIYYTDINTPIDIILTARDSFYNDNSGTLTTEQYNNKAYLFDGEDNYIELNPIENFAKNHKVSFSFWIYHKRGNYYWEESILNFIDKNNNNKRLDLVFNQINYYEGEIIYRINNKKVLVSSPVQYYKWYHISIVHDSNNYAKMYINGNIDVSFSQMNTKTDLIMEKLPILTIDLSNIDNNKLFLGINYDHNNASNNTNYLKAEFKSFYIFNDILSSVYINYLYNYEIEKVFDAGYTSIINNRSFNLIGELSYFVNTVKYINKPDCIGLKNQIKENTLNGVIKDVENKPIFGNNYEISKFLNINNKDKDNLVTFYPKEKGLSYFTFYVKERDTDISSNLATIKIYVTGKKNTSCTNKTLIPIRDWARVDNICNNEIKTNLTLIKDKIQATEHKQNVKITKKQQYANIANKRFQRLNVKRC